MRLIIDIPEKVVTAIQNGEDYRYDIHTAIAQGIPYEERQQGEWEVFYTPKMKKVFRCNKCQAVSIQGKTKFCYNCGTSMKGGAE